VEIGLAKPTAAIRESPDRISERKNDHYKQRVINGGFDTVARRDANPEPNDDNYDVETPERLLIQ
jgi:hypothetical protein